MARPTGRHLRDEILAAATSQIQHRGVTGFSFGSLAKELGVRAPSIHHHFPNKEALVAAVAADYRHAFASHVDAIPPGTARERLGAFAELFSTQARHNRLCLCGALSADWLAIGDLPRSEVESFFDDQRAWLITEIEEGMADGEIASAASAPAVAGLLLTALEGAVLLERSTSNVDVPQEVMTTIDALVAA